jgi:hypothetical protein
LEADLPRLYEFDRNLIARGVGMKRLAPGEAPPALPAPAKKGGPK